MKSAYGALSALLISACASAPQASDPWPMLTARDVDAAYQLLAEDHPAMSREISAAVLRDNFETGRSLALERARTVRNYDGYRAVLAGLATSAGDKHIWSRPLYQSETLQWAGLIVSRRGDRYVVVEHDGAETGASLAGAALVSCDGVAADEFAAQKLGGFRAVWSIEAQRIQRAPELLIDDGNPFVLRPSVCVFDQGGREIAHTLAWREIARSDLGAHTRPARNRGAAGFGVRSFGAGGRWIALQSLDDRAPAVVAAVEAQQAALRAAPVVVFDLRGNGGGNSDYGRQIAMAIYGEAHVRAMLDGAEGGDCGSVWRVSARNIETMRDYARRFRDSAPEFSAEIDTQIAAAGRAQAERRDFTGPTTCPSEQAGGTAASAPSQARGRVVLLTDNTCFSSCLLVTDAFRRLGALHVGQATDANTHFMEVREAALPSGLSMFSTLQALGPAAPPQIGPFAPTHVYGGDIGDTPAVEAWVAGLARGG